MAANRQVTSAKLGVTTGVRLMSYLAEQAQVVGQVAHGAKGVGMVLSGSSATVALRILCGKLLVAQWIERPSDEGEDAGSNPVKAW